MSRLSVRGAYVFLGMAVILDALWIGAIVGLVYCGVRACLT